MCAVAVLLVAAILSGAESIPQFGACPSITGLTNFNLNNYLGAWYEYSRSFNLFEVGASCVRATYTNQGGTVGVLNEMIDPFQKYRTIQGTAKLADPTKPDSANFIVSFDGVPFTGLIGRGEPNYRVVATDYTSYAVVWSCTQLPFIRFEQMWVLTRAQVPNQATIDTAIRSVSSLGLSPSLLTPTPQKNCATLPAVGK